MNGPKALFLLVVGVLSVGAMTVIEPRTSLDNRDEAPVIEPIYAPPVEQVVSHELKSGEGLSALLMRASIAGGDLAELLRAMSVMRTPKTLSPGVEVTIRKLANTGEARVVEVRLNRDTTIRLTRKELVGWTASTAITPIVIDTMFMSGTIAKGQSLYESVAYDTTLHLPLDERIQLVDQVADIFESKVDFLKDIQPGDRYAVAMEREARPDGSMRSSRILVSRLDSRGERYDAVLFNADGFDKYYDLNGKPMETAFRRYPLEYVRITSAFNPNRYHPILGIHRAHLGTDFGAQSGTPVKAVADGVVISVGRDRGYGNVVTLRHPNGYSTRYAHLRGFAADIRVGKRVMMNSTIGYVGMTGLATAPHLHYELRMNGKAINFKNVIIPSTPPLPLAYRDQYRAVVKDRLVLLETAALGARLARTPASANPAVGGGY